jgi:hypothetical protein
MTELLVINRYKEVIIGTRRNFRTEIRCKNATALHLMDSLSSKWVQVNGRLHVPATLHFVSLGLRTDLIEVAQKKIPDPARKLTPVVQPPA